MSSARTRRFLLTLPKKRCGRSSTLGLSAEAHRILGEAYGTREIVPVDYAKDLRAHGSRRNTSFC